MRNGQTSKDPDSGSLETKNGGDRKSEIKSQQLAFDNGQTFKESNF